MRGRRGRRGSTHNYSRNRPTYTLKHQQQLFIQSYHFLMAFPLTLPDCCVVVFRFFLERVYATVSGLDGGTNASVSFCICLFISLFLSFFLAHTLIVLGLTGYSQPAIEMSCGGVGWGGVACCGKLVFGILTHMHNLTCILYVCFIVVMANVCMYACLCEHNTPLVLL